MIYRLLPTCGLTQKNYGRAFSALLVRCLGPQTPVRTTDNAPTSIACIIIYVMGLTFLKMDQSRVKWRIKLSEAFAHRAGKALFSFLGNNEDGEPERQLTEEELAEEQAMKKKARSGKYAIFFLPFITVVREGLEAIVFVGGVSWASSPLCLCFTY